MRLGRNMARRGQRQLRIGQARGRVHCLAQRRCKIDITRLVVRRIRIRDIRGQDLLALLTQGKGLLMEAEVLVDLIDHDGPWSFAQDHSNSAFPATNIKTSHCLSVNSEIGSTSCQERVCQYVYISVGAV